MQHIVEVVLNLVFNLLNLNGDLDENESALFKSISNFFGVLL